MVSKKKCAAMLLGGSMMCLGGTCVPEDFWVDTWGYALTRATGSVVDVVMDTYVVDPLIDNLVPAEE